MEHCPLLNFVFISIGACVVISMKSVWVSFLGEDGPKLKSYGLFGSRGGEEE